MIDDSQRAFRGKLGIFQHGVQCILKNLRKLDKGGTKEEMAGLKRKKKTV